VIKELPDTNPKLEMYGLATEMSHFHFRKEKKTLKIEE
jgi:hypothetical protein